MPTYNVSTGFTGIDKVTPAFKRMGKSAFAASTKMKGAFKSVNKVGAIVGGTLIAGGITKGISIISNGIGGLAREFVSFDDAIVGAGAKFKDINLSTAQGQKQLLALKQAAKEAGATTVFSTAESAKGLEFLAMAGFTSVQAMESLNTIQNLAIATGVEFAQAADQSSDLLGAFGLAAEDATVQAKNFERLNDVLTKTANSANVSLSDMFETMKVAGPIAGAYGASLEEVAAITGILGNAGIKGSQAATALKNVMLRLAAPTSAASGMLKDLGIQTADADGNMRKITDIMADVGKATEKMGSKNKLKVFNELFGKIPIAAAVNISKMIPSINKLEEALNNAKGTAKLTAEQMSKSLGNRLKLLSSSVSAFAFKFFEAFAGEGTNGITILTNAISKFDVKPIINGLKIAFTVISGLVSFLKATAPIWIAVVIGIKAYSLAITIAAIKTKIWALSQGGLNAALTANPIGAIIVGIAALIAIIALIVIHWDAITAAVMSAWLWFDKYRILILAILGPIGVFINMMITLGAGIIKTFKAFKDGGFIAGIKELGRTLFDFVMVPLQSILTIMSKIPGFKGVGAAGLENISELRAAIFGGDSEQEAPNAAREDSKRALDGKIDLNIKTSPGLESSVEKNTAENVDINNAGLNN